MSGHLFIILLGVGLAAQQEGARSPVDTSLLREMRWRMIGPHRASRSKAVDGIPGQPHTFFMGVVNGGVWKTTDAGRTWIRKSGNQGIRGVTLASLIS